MVGANQGTSLQTTPRAPNVQSGRIAQALMQHSAQLVREVRSGREGEGTAAQAARSAQQERSAKQMGQAPPTRALRAQVARSAQPLGHRASPRAASVLLEHSDLFLAQKTLPSVFRAQAVSSAPSRDLLLVIIAKPERSQ